MRSAPMIPTWSALLLAVLGAEATPAHAHAILLASQPPAGATLPPGPTHLELRYNSRIDRRLSRLELRQPGHDPVPLMLAPSPDDRLVADATLPPGPVTLRWQVLAVDGHITRGDVALTVAAP